MLGRRSLNRDILGLNPTNAVSNLGRVRLPHVAVSWDAFSISEKDGGMSKTKGGRQKA